MERYNLGVVEAAGVEPASEKARHEKNYVRVRFWIVGGRIRTGEENDRLARLISTFGYEQKPTAQTAI
jgi:hypothetical protein